MCIEFSLKYFSCDCGVQLPIQMLILIAISSSWMLRSRKIYYFTTAFSHLVPYFNYELIKATVTLIATKK